MSLKASIRFASLLSLVFLFVLLPGESSLWAAKKKKKAAAAPKGDLVLIAIKDFKNLKEGEVPYYLDKGRKALAIDAAKKEYRDKWAQVSFVFKLEAGSYDVTITTLTEEDGECEYQLLINGKKVGEFQNPRVKKDKDMKPLNHVWQGIKLKKGDKVGLRAKSHSNGIIPEHGSFAWARGRWRSLVFNLK